MDKPKKQEIHIADDMVWVRASVMTSECNKVHDEWEKYHKFRVDDLWQQILSLPGEEEIEKILNPYMGWVWNEKKQKHCNTSKETKELAKAISKRIRGE